MYVSRYIFNLKRKRLPSVYPFHSIPSVRPSYPSTHIVHPSILSVHLHSYLFTYLPIYLYIYQSIYLSFDPSIYLYTFIQRCNPWAACGLKIQERTIFNPKQGTGGTDNKKHWEAVLTTCASARIQTIQTDYKAKLHRFRHLLMQIAWFVSFSNFPSAADGHILLNALDLFWPPKLSRREPAQYWPRGLVGKCLGCCRLLMHGGTQTIRFWGLQHVHWCEGSCCWFLRLQSRLVWDVPKALQGRQGMCGSLAGWFQVAIQAVDWCVPEHHL